MIPEAPVGGAETPRMESQVGGAETPRAGSEDEPIGDDDGWESYDESNVITTHAPHHPTPSGLHTTPSRSGCALLWAAGCSDTCPHAQSRPPRPRRRGGQPVASAGSGQTMSPRRRRRLYSVRLSGCTSCATPLMSSSRSAPPLTLIHIQIRWRSKYGWPTDLT